MYGKHEIESRRMTRLSFYNSRLYLLTFLKIKFKFKNNEIYAYENLFAESKE